jgi:hypothetical protein
MAAPSPDPLAKPSAYLEGAADGLADGLEREEPETPLQQTLHRASETFASHPSPRSERLRAKLDQVEDKVSEAVDKTRVRARAVAETARRAREAPPTLAEELTGALRSWTSGLAKGLGLKVAGGVIAAIAFTVLTVGLVQWLNLRLGYPRGAFVVAVAYGLLAAIAFAAGKGKAAKGKMEAKAQLIAAREEIRHVTRPVRRAFRGDDDLAVRSGLKDTVELELPDDGTTFGEDYADEARR